MRFLALDVGTRRTGIAYYDDELRIVLPLDTISHFSFDELFAEVERIVRDRGVGHIFVGHPLLPSGIEGSQVALVRQFLGFLERAGLSHSLIDERYSTPRSSIADGNAIAACSLLEMGISKR